MKKFLAILILIFTLPTSSQADDIRDFQIEGISIGDSALDFFQEDEIKKNIRDWYPDKKYIYSSIAKKSFEKYDKIGFFYKANDKTYTIVSLSASLICKKNINDCKKIQKEVKKEFSILFSELDQNDSIYKYPTSVDNGSGSKAIQNAYFFKNGDQIVIETKDWSKNSKFTDNFSVNLDTEKFSIWLDSIS